MQLYDIEIPADANLFLFGDAHMCSSFHYDEGLDVILNMIHSSWGGLPVEHNFGWDHGDTAEMIFIDDRRFDFDSQNPRDTVQTQRDYVIKRYREFGGKLMGISDGNHMNNKKFLVFGQVMQEICEKIGVRYGTFSSRITYRDWLSNETVLFRHFVGHGWGTVKSRVRPLHRANCNMEIQLRQALENKASDCMLSSMGHTHRLLVYRPDSQLYMYGNSERIIAGWTNSDEWYGEQKFIPEDLRWYVNTGSLLKLYNRPGQVGYAETAGYDPIPIGFAIAEVRDGRIRDIKRIAVDNAAPKGYIVLKN